MTLNCYANLAVLQLCRLRLALPAASQELRQPGLAAAGLTSSSAVDYNTLEAERTYFNTATLNWAPSRRFSAYVGYRYGRRELRTCISGNNHQLADPGRRARRSTPVPPTTADRPLSTDKINQHTALGGVVLRPTDKWRINADVELMYADNGFTQIAPRHEQRVRANAVYKVNRWASINGSVHFIESRNDWAQNFGGPGVNLFPTADAPAYGNKSHDRYYSLGASLQPNRRVSLDFGWTYMDQWFNIPACMLLTAGVCSAAALRPSVPSLRINQPMPATLNVGAATPTCR